MATKHFLSDDLLLSSKAASRLYEEICELPIYDFHCHLDAQEILDNKHFRNLCELWLEHDHYKWRLMRTMGVSEDLITGSADDYDKFLAYCECLETAIGNPLYVWSHMELSTYFDIHLPITKENAPIIWNLANARLAQSNFSVLSLLEKSNVELVATTNDPIDTLSAHKEIGERDDIKTRVVPTFRPDRVLFPEKEDFTEYITSFANLRRKPIDTFGDLKNALKERLDYFVELGSFVSDHAIHFNEFAPLSDEDANIVFTKGLDREEISPRELEGYRATLMLFLGKEYHARGMVMQLHMGALRNVNKKMFARLGADSGFDTIGDPIPALPLTEFLNALDEMDALPRTILYSLNPNDNAVLSAMCGNFTEEGIRGKVQAGAAWWMNDHALGIRQHLGELSSRSALSVFVGMLTDSRSFLSYARHDYFRRILASFLTELTESGSIGIPMETLEKIAADISYHNAKNYFRM